MGHKYWYENVQETVRTNLNRVVGPFRFVPLVSPSLNLICELHIFMLRPESPGALITQGGDIDNRLKTLFDALRMPKKESELPKDAVVAPDEDPFFCLLEDDNLITGVSVKTDRLLFSSENDSQVHLDILVETRPTKMMTKINNGYELSSGIALV